MDATSSQIVLPAFAPLLVFNGFSVSIGLFIEKRVKRLIPL